MPVLDWLGKDKIIDHHQEVPFRVLERRWSFGDEDGACEGAPAGGNMIVKGDNLEALKALLPRYEGRVGCVYIDPPYNTGNEGWAYNDNVNDPRIARWLGKAVGRELEDLTRHDKWLCMMWPRLQLLRRLLSEDGAIFISIDDNEQAHLKLICDEIFGAPCFVADISWQRTYSTRNDSTGIVSEVEHLLVYSRRPGWDPNKLSRTAEMDSKYKNPDNDDIPWKSSDASAPGAATHQGMVYAIQHPFTGEMIYPPNRRCWPFSQEQIFEIMNGWARYELRDLDDAARRAQVCGIPQDQVRPGVMGIVLSDPLEAAAAQAQEVYDRGRWPRFYFTKGGKGGIARKVYLDDVGGKPPTNLWPYAETGHTDEAAKELAAIFDGRSPFDTPKPVRLIERVLHIAAGPEDLVLDSFAGSGTTAHAVLKMNAADGGRRRFILVEMMDYAEDLTAERVRRAITGYGTGKNAVEGLGGGFSFYELGQPILSEEGLLAPDLPLEALREHVWYTETGTAWPGLPDAARPYLLGEQGEVEIFFCFEPDRPMTLDHELLARLGARGPALVWADLCLIAPGALSRLGVRFKKIPRDIRRL